jgi:hypothetical protein
MVLNWMGELQPRLRPTPEKGGFAVQVLNLQEQHLQPKPDLDVSDRLSESEVAAISQFLSIEQTAVKSAAKVSTVQNTESEPMREQSPMRLGLILFSDALVFYAIVLLAQAVLDVEDLNIGFQLQIHHYSVAYFWLDVSVVMTLVAGCEMENLRLRPARWFGML